MRVILRSLIDRKFLDEIVGLRRAMKPWSEPAIFQAELDGRFFVVDVAPGSCMPTPGKRYVVWSSRRYHLLTCAASDATNLLPFGKVMFDIAPERFLLPA